MKLIVASVVLSVLLMQGALAVTYSYTFANGASETSGGYDIGGAATITLAGNAKACSASNHFFAMGPISTYRTANSGNGLAHAKSEFSVTGPSARTMYEFSSSSNTYSASTSESLTSFDADTITAKATGWNSNGDTASSEIKVTSPSNDKAILMDYWNNAYGYQYSTSNAYAQTKQSCAWADVSDSIYGNIFIKQYAKEGHGDWSWASLNIPYGRIHNPYPSSPYYIATAYASKSSNSGKGSTYAKQSTNAYGKAYSSPVGYYYGLSQSQIAGKTLKQSGIYFATGTHTTSQYAWTTYPNYGATTTHNV